jgi:MFS family permease
MIDAAARLHNVRDTHRVLWQHRGRGGNRMKLEKASARGVERGDNAAAIRSITRRYWAMWGLRGLAGSFIFAMYPLFLRARGLDQFQVNVVAAWYLVVTFLTDVPTGAFADAVGRRASVIIGCLFHVAGLFLYFVSHHYWQFILAETFEGFGDTFGNGPIDAWAVDALDAAGFVGSKDRVFSRQFQIIRLTGMTGGLIGAYIAERDIALPFLICAVGWAIAAIGAALLIDPAPPRAASVSRRQIVRDIRRKTVDSTRLGFNHRGVRLLSSAAFITTAVWSAWWLEWPEFFNRGFGAGIGAVGWVFAAISAVQMAGAEIAARAPWAWERRAGFIAAMSAFASAALIVAGAAAGHIWIALAAILFAHLVSGAIGPMLISWYNELIEGENRATLLSFQTTLMTAGGAIGQPVQGRMVDAIGIPVTWQIAGALSMTQALCYIAAGRPREPA